MPSDPQKTRQEFHKLIAEGKRLLPIAGNMVDGQNGAQGSEYTAWRLNCMTLLGRLGQKAAHILSELRSAPRGSSFYDHSVRTVQGCLEAGLAIARRQEAEYLEDARQARARERQQKAATSRERTGNDPMAKAKPPSNKVFLVHGHDKAAQQEVARFLEKLDLDVTILSEKPGKSRTIIEKFEHHADVHFAVVLLTADDMGKANAETDLKPRARQNVILELGYFIARLTRAKVAALKTPGVDVPSDFHGVEYIDLDAAGAWKSKLAQEMIAAGLPIDMNKTLS